MLKYSVVTIEREFASGGKQIGERLAKRLGFKFYNEEILEMAAKKLDVSIERVRFLEENTTNGFLYTMAIAAEFTEDQHLADKLFYIESEIISGLAIEGNCVIVGRCAGQILTNRKSCLNVFIGADEANRVDRAINEYNISAENICTALKKHDKRRAGFYRTRAKTKWNSMSNYDICLNSGTLGIDACVEILATTIQI